VTVAGFDVVATSNKWRALFVTPRCDYGDLHLVSQVLINDCAKDYVYTSSAASRITDVAALT